MSEQKPKWVRVAKSQWVAVDPVTGIDPITGNRPTPYEPTPELKSLRMSKAPRSKKSKLSPKFRAKHGIVDLNSKGDPNGATWALREPLAAYEWARLAYLEEGKTLREIAEHTGFKERLVRDWAYRGCEKRNSWSEDKRVQQNKTVQAILKSTRDQCVDTVKQMLGVIDTKVRSITEEEAKGLSVADVKRLVECVGDLHKISQLESGDPTAIVQNVKRTAADVKRMLQEADPLVDYGFDDEEGASGSTESETTH